MKVKDLRIGNLVYGGFEDDEENSNHSVCVVTGLSEDQHLGEGWNFMLENMERKDVENYFEMKPIPLTEEWFKNFGFEIRYFNNDENLPIWWKVIKNRHIDIYPHTEHGFYFLINSIQMSVPIITVHQLQNLYFALCGEELELK